MNNLEQALSFANYQYTLTKERKLLAQKFQENIVLAHNGGLFKVTPEFVAGLKAVRSEWALDINNNPVKIEDLDAFILEAQLVWEKAITEYGNEFTALRSKRNVKSLVNL